MSAEVGAAEGMAQSAAYWHHRLQRDLEARERAIQREKRPWVRRIHEQVAMHLEKGEIARIEFTIERHGHNAR